MTDALLQPDLFRTAMTVAIVALLAGASLHDMAVRTIPNTVSLALAAVGLALQAAAGELGTTMLAGAAMFAGAWLCWRLGWLGGGDVKLLAACALVVGAPEVPTLVLATAISGSAIALFYLLLPTVLPHAAPVLPPPGARPARLVRRLWRAERRRMRRRGPLPYACAISAGVVFTLCQNG